MATKHPIRMLLSIIDDEDLISKYVDYFKYGDTEIKNIYRQLEAGINVGLTTSTGRVLDSGCTFPDKNSVLVKTLIIPL